MIQVDVDVDAIGVEQLSDWDVRNMEAEEAFSLNPIPDDCVDAANRASALFDQKFPGWELYCLVARNDLCFKRKLLAWGISCARLYTRATKQNGKPVVAKGSRQNEWIRWAADDALHFLCHSRFPHGSQIGREMGVTNMTYQRVRVAIAKLCIAGFKTYSNELHYQYRSVGRQNFRQENKY